MKQCACFQLRITHQFQLKTSSLKLWKFYSGVLLVRSNRRARGPHRRVAARSSDCFCSKRSFTRTAFHAHTHTRKTIPIATDTLARVVFLKTSQKVNCGKANRKKGRTTLHRNGPCGFEIPRIRNKHTPARQPFSASGASGTPCTLHASSLHFGLYNSKAQKQKKTFRPDYQASLKCDRNRVLERLPFQIE